MAKIKAPTSAGKQVNELIIKSGLSPEEATRRILGNLADKYTLPQGATIITSGVNDLIYKDAQGYTHHIQRGGDATQPDFGRVREVQTDRPAVLPLTEQIPGLSGALQSAINAISGGGGLRPLSPEDESALSAISQNERNLLNQEATKAQGELITGLYGRGINQSTIANEAAADFSQALGIALGNQAAGAASRKLDLQKFLTQLISGQSLNLLNTVAGQETQRGIAGEQIKFGREGLEQQSTEAARNFMLQWDKLQAELNKSKLPGILSSIASIAANIIAP